MEENYYLPFIFKLFSQIANFLKYLTNYLCFWYSILQMLSSKWNSTLAISISIHILSLFFFFWKICIELEIANVKFQAKFDINNIKIQILNNIKIQNKSILRHTHIWKECCFAKYFKNKGYLAIFSQVLIRWEEQRSGSSLQ